MSLDILREDNRWADTPDAHFERAVSAALSGVGLAPSDFEVSLLVCDDARIAMLNEDFRQKGQATNVLSWPSAERGAAREGQHPSAPQLPFEAELGDIAIAYETCAREAGEAGKPFDDHVTHLIIHATLHLLGYDHIREGDAALMEGVETEILGKLDIPDPYS